MAGEVSRKKKTHAMSDNTKKGLKWGGGITVGIIFILLLNSQFGWFAFGWGSPKYTTFQVYSYPDGEDVSKFFDLQIKQWDSDKKFTEEKDLRRLSNFKTVTTDDAVDIKIDVTDPEYSRGFWVILDPNAAYVFETEYIFVKLSKNVKNYKLDAHQLSSDVNWNGMDITDYSPFLSLGANESTDGNYTFHYNFPIWTTTDTHVGEGWAMSTDDFNDLAAAQQADYYDERSWRCQAPTYNPNNDTDLDYTTTWERITNCFGFRFTANDSISTVDEATTQINCTIDEDLYPGWSIQISGTYIYIVSSVVRTVPNSFMVEIEFGSAIEIDTGVSGRFNVFGGLDSIALSATYSTIAA